MSEVFERFRRDFFPDAERHTLSVEILSEDWQALQALFAENEWQADDGLRFTLAAGRAYLEALARLTELQHPDTDLADIADQMAHAALKRVIVVDAQGRAMGSINDGDLMATS